VGTSVSPCKEAWAGKTLDCLAWGGDLATAAKALEKVGGVKAGAYTRPLFSST
jgi:hypothetical protein